MDGHRLHHWKEDVFRPVVTATACPTPQAFVCECVPPLPSLNNLNLSFSTMDRALTICSQSSQSNKVEGSVPALVFIFLCGIFIFLRTRDWISLRCACQRECRQCILWWTWNLCSNSTFGRRVPPLFDIHLTDGATYCFIWLFPAANKTAWFF